MIGMAKRVGNLYLFINSTASATVCNVSFNKNALWHSRLGHTSFTKLTMIDNELHFNPVNDDITHYSICHLSKQKGLPFLSNNNICDTAFDIIHINIWGPFFPETIEGFKYFLTIVDHTSPATGGNVL